jgi:hypothetical protein
MKQKQIFIFDIIDPIITWKYDKNIYMYDKNNEILMLDTINKSDIIIAYDTENKIKKLIDIISTNNPTHSAIDKLKSYKN